MTDELRDPPGRPAGARPCALALRAASACPAAAQRPRPPRRPAAAPADAGGRAARARARRRLPGTVGGPTAEVASPASRSRHRPDAQRHGRSVGNDYLFRGISQTRNNWAFQGTVDLAARERRLYRRLHQQREVPGQPYNNTRQELDVLAGYRFDLAGINFDLGYIAYTYPGQDQAGRARSSTSTRSSPSRRTTPSTSVKLLGAFAYSPNFFGRSGTGYYVEGGLDLDPALSSSPPSAASATSGSRTTRASARRTTSGTASASRARSGARLHRRGRLVRHQHRKNECAPVAPRHRRPAHLRGPGAVHPHRRALRRLLSASRRSAPEPLPELPRNVPACG